MLLKKAEEEIPTINLTPMLDVVFNLIVFFMVGTKFVEMDHEIKLQVPQVAHASPLTAAPSRRVVCVTREGTVTLDGQPLALPELTNRLRQAKAEYPALGVTVKGDGGGVFENVADALSAVNGAGIDDTSICVRLDSEGTQRR